MVVKLFFVADLTLKTMVAYYSDYNQANERAKSVSEHNNHETLVVESFYQSQPDGSLKRVMSLPIYPSYDAKEQTDD